MELPGHPAGHSRIPGGCGLIREDNPTSHLGVTLHHSLRPSLQTQAAMAGNRLAFVRSQCVHTKRPAIDEKRKIFSRYAGLPKGHDHIALGRLQDQFIQGRLDLISGFLGNLPLGGEAGNGIPGTSPCSCSSR